MDGNKDESEKCIRLAEDHLSKMMFKKGLYYAQKAHRLYPTEDTKTLLGKAKLLAEKHQQNEEENPKTNSETSNRRETSNGQTSSNDQPKSVDYIKNCKDYYEILGVSKNATESEIKRQYRKLALQFHPDKNKSPGAAEVFKAIGNAFAVLNDPEKRRKYDQIGSKDGYENPFRTRRRSDGFDYTHGFDEDFNAEEIFNMFFGRGFPARNVYVYRNGHTYQQRTNNHESQTTAGYTVLLQIMPILFFICISLLSNLVPDNPYSLTRSQKYPYQRYTDNYQVAYYVKENFERDHKDNLQKIQSQVEESYISNLQTSCFKEKNYKENLIYRAQFLHDTQMESKAQNLKTPSCDRLVKIQKSYY